MFLSVQERSKGFLHYEESYLLETTKGHKKLLVEYKGEKPERNLSGFDHSLLSEMILARHLPFYQVRIISFRFCSFLIVTCLLGRIRFVQWFIYCYSDSSLRFMWLSSVGNLLAYILGYENWSFIAYFKDMRQRWKKAVQSWYRRGNRFQ